MEPPVMPGEEATPERDDVAARLRAWLGCAFALWCERGLDERGLFFEQMSFAAAPDRDSPRRVLVQGRQLFAVGRAAARGVAGADDLLARALPAIAAHAWAVDGAPGWIHVLGPDGAPRDRARDTYDQSFLLFGLAEMTRRNIEGAAMLGERSWEFVETLADPAHGGFREGAPPSLPRRSNPHMHLLEASLAWHDVTGDARHRDRADAIADLFAARFFDRAGSTLGEFFDDRLHRLDDPRGDIVEPGHMFEWSWLLHRLAQAGGRDLRAEAGAMHRWAMAHGRDATGFAVDETDRDGRVRRATRRAWPQTELIKSALANGDPATAIRVAGAFLDTYLATGIAGLWTDRFDPDGRAAAPVVPASTLYHVVVAFEELLDRLDGDVDRDRAEPGGGRLRRCG